MKEILIYLRNKFSGFFYRQILKRIFFLQDPEKVHDKMTYVGQFLGKYKISKIIISWFFNYQNKKLEQTILGIRFKNPVGLAAGFDKDALLTDILPYVGFGFEEIGSITGEYCNGNPKPRLWRLKKSKSLIVYYGLKNLGCEIISNNLKNKKFNFVIGTSIAKTNSPETVELEPGIKDYVKAFSKFTGIGDYFTINISCPNACGGEPFTNPQYLEKLLTEIDKIKTQKPIFLKLSADLSQKEIDEILTITNNHKIDGFICTNLTKKRGNEKIKDDNIPEKGGISGKVVEDLSNEMIKYIYQKTKGKYIIIGCGGIFSPQDAYKKIKLGASLVQLISGMIFEGPQLISEINIGLVKLLKKDGYQNISQAIGTENK